MINGRSCLFLMMAVFAACVSAPVGAQSASDLGMTVRRISTRSAVVTGGPWNNSYLALSTQKGIVVVDSGFSKTIAKAVREAIREEFKRNDFAYLIISHEHSDHFFGNGAYSDIPIVGSDLLRSVTFRMKSDPTIVKPRLEIPQRSLAYTREQLLKTDPKALEGPKFAQEERFWKIVQADYGNGVDLVPPTIVFDRRLTLDLGDMSIHLFSFGQWHSSADTVISVPEENLVRLGAIFAPGLLPVVKFPNEPPEALTADVVNNWIAVFHEVLSETNDKTQFISCHGWSVMTRDQVAQDAAYVEKLWNEVRRAKAAGKTLEQAKQATRRAELFPEVALLKDEAYGISGIHQRNIEILWNAAP